MSKFLRILSAIAIILSSLAVQPARAISDPTGCDDVRFIFARGSGEPIDGPNFSAWRTAIEKQLAGSDLKYSFYDLGTSKQGTSQYKAVAVAGSLDGFFTAIGAYVGAGEGYKFGESVKDGAYELRYYLLNSSHDCPNMKYVLGGYSQGALVLSSPLANLPAYNSNIIYISNFGDPKLYLPEGSGTNPAACHGRQFSPYRAYVPDCHTYQGVLGAIRPYYTDTLHSRIGVWCNDHDIMCSSGWSLSDHTSYVARGLYDNAATKIMTKVRQAFSGKSFPSFTPEVGQDVVILLDDTWKSSVMPNSRLRTRAIDLASRIHLQGGRVALYTYSDSAAGQTKARCDFTCSLDEFRTAVLEAGNYPPDFTGPAVNITFDTTLNTAYTTMKEQSWKVGAKKSIVTLSEYNLGAKTYDRKLFKAVVDLSLSIDPVNFFAVADDPEEQAVLTELSMATNGQVFSSNQAEQAFETIISRPAPGLSAEKYTGAIGEEIEFAVNNPSALLRYDWDLDADGKFELQDAGTAVTKVYREAISGFVQVRATDQTGNSSTMSAVLEITTEPERQTWITSLEVTEIDASTFHIKLGANVVTDRILVIADDVPLGHLKLSERQEFTLTDVPAGGVTLRLTSYNAHDRRSSQTLEFLVKHNYRIPDFYLEDPYRPFVIPSEPTDESTDEPTGPVDDHEQTTGRPSGDSSMRPEQPEQDSERTGQPAQPSGGAASTASPSQPPARPTFQINLPTDLETLKQEAYLIKKSRLPKVPNTGVRPKASN